MLDRKTFPQNPVQYSKGTFMHCRLFFNITSCSRNGNALTDVKLVPPPDLPTEGLISIFGLEYFLANNKKVLQCNL